MEKNSILIKLALVLKSVVNLNIKIMKKVILLTLILMSSIVFAQRKKIHTKYEAEFEVLESDENYEFSFENLKEYDLKKVNNKNKKAFNRAIKINGSGRPIGLFYDNKYIYYYFEHLENSKKFVKYIYDYDMNYLKNEVAKKEEIEFVVRISSE